jgi:hypothetical protein
MMELERLKDVGVAGARRRYLQSNALWTRARDRRSPFSVQIKPSKTKPGQIKPSSFAWFNSSEA